MRIGEPQEIIENEPAPIPVPRLRKVSTISEGSIRAEELVPDVSREKVPVRRRTGVKRIQRLEG